MPINSVRIAYDLTSRQPTRGSETPGAVVRDTLYNPLVRAILLPSVDSGVVTCRWSKSAPSNAATVIVPIHSDTLRQGQYALHVTAWVGDTTRSETREFEIRWFDMPAALHSLPFAVDALQYIADEKTFHEMQHASEKDQRMLFDKFWLQRDPTPGTAYNEMMAEYYRRVDHVFAAFRTFRQANGVHTDRGKAYILYGPPASLERSLTPGSVPTETWAYPSLHQKLVFTDEHRTGDYQLEANITVP